MLSSTGLNETQHRRFGSPRRESSIPLRLTQVISNGVLARSSQSKLRCEKLLQSCVTQERGAVMLGADMGKTKCPCWRR